MSPGVTIGRSTSCTTATSCCRSPASPVDGVVIVPHVETATEHRGNNYSSVLMDGVVEDLRTRGLRIKPMCWVARRYVESLPDAET